MYIPAGCRGGRRVVCLWLGINLISPLNAEPVFVVLRYMYRHQRTSIITNALLTYTMYMENKTLDISDKYSKTCPIAHQRLNFQILPNLDLAKCMPLAVRELDCSLTLWMVHIRLNLRVFQHNSLAPPSTRQCRSWTMLAPQMKLSASTSSIYSTTICRRLASTILLVVMQIQVYCPSEGSVFMPPKAKVTTDINVNWGFNPYQPKTYICIMI